MTTPSTNTPPTAPTPKPANNLFGELQKIGKALMLPVAVLPAAGLLLGIGAALQGTTWFPAIVANIMVQASGVIFDNLALVFALGVAIGLAAGDGVAALAALIGFLVLNGTMSAYLGLGDSKTFDALSQQYPGAYAKVLGIPTLQTGVFGGILTGILAAQMYNRFFTIKLPPFLGFFAGKRFVPIATAIAALVLGILLTFIWPPIQGALNAFSHFATSTAPTLSSVLFGIVNRLLIPFGLHHIWNQTFWFQAGQCTDAAGLILRGDLTCFVKGAPNTGFGTFMVGFYPIMMFGLPAAALAIYHEAKPEKRILVASIMASAALTSFLTGITEPIEFSFLFVAPVLYVFHAIFTGLSFAILNILDVKHGFTFSAGLIDYLVLFSKANQPLLILLLGSVYAFLYYFTFRFAIRTWNLKTPGREDDSELSEERKVFTKTLDRPSQVLAALGGPNNIITLDACITRLRVTVVSTAQVDEHALKQLGAAGVLKMGNNIQAIFGTISDELKTQVLERMPAPLQAATQPTIPRPTPTAPATPASFQGGVLPAGFTQPVVGRVLPLNQVPDQVFSDNLMGEGFAIDPSEGFVYAPCNATIITVFPTHHAIGLRCENGLEVLIHFGLDTVNLKGEGFTSHIREGDQVTKGQLLLTVNLDVVRRQAPSLITPIILTNLPRNRHVRVVNGQVRIV